MQKGNLFVEDRHVARRGDVVGNDKWEPEIIVGKARADAAAGGRVPPVLDVPLFELTRCRTQDVFPCQMRKRVDKGHDVLQLIAEAEGAARLIEGRAAPDATTQCLIKEPAV